MTDDDIIRMYQDLLRQAPENKDLKDSIKRWHRRKEACSQRASPPPRRTLDALKKLLTESLRQNPDKRPSPDLPIDAEISKLYRRTFALTHSQPVVVRRFELRPNVSGRRRAGITRQGRHLPRWKASRC
jgi:hypothetical protein